MNRTHPILTRESAVVLVIDLQEKLLPVIHDGESVVAEAVKLIRAAGILGVPLVATEQYPAGLGNTSRGIVDVWGEVKPIEKMNFSACVEGVIAELGRLSRPHVIVAGVEAHVCVQQSVLDLLRSGYQPFVCADAVSSRRPLDREVAIERMRDAGAIITTVESAVFEIIAKAGTDEFKKVLKIVK